MVYWKTTKTDPALSFVTHPAFPLSVNVFGSLFIMFYVRYLLRVQLPAKLREDAMNDAKEDYSFGDTVIGSASVRANDSEGQAPHDSLFFSNLQDPELGSAVSWNTAQTNS